MKKKDLEKRISKILNEEETFILSLILLAHMHDDEKYKNLSELTKVLNNLLNIMKELKLKYLHIKN